MEKKYFLTVPSWEVHDRHVVFNISTMPPQGETLNTKRRYSEFERLNRRLGSRKLEKLQLPGKLLVHSDAAIEQRRSKLERALKFYIETQGMNPLLEEFLTPRDDAAGLLGSRPSAGGESVLLDDASVLTARVGGEVPLEVGPAEPLLSPEISEDEDHHQSGVVSREQYPVWALEMLVARASYRAERKATFRLARIYTLATLATLLGSFSSKVHRWPLLGAAFGTAISAGFAYMSALLFKRGEDWRRRGFGLQDSPSRSSDGADVRNFVTHMQGRSAKPTSEVLVAAQASEAAVPLAVAQTSQTVPEAETATVAGGAVDEALLASLDALHDQSRHAEVVSQTKGAANPHLAWRWGRAVYYQTLPESDSQAVVPRLEEVLDVLNATSRRSAVALVHKWIAIVHNAIGGRRGTIKDRVEAGLSFQRNTERALELDPNDATLHYMAGRFAFDVTGLSWWERQGAKAISGKEPPKATYEEALEHYRKAISIKDSPAFRLAEGNTLEKLKRPQDALEVYKRAAAITAGADGKPLTVEEEYARGEAAELVRKLS